MKRLLKKIVPITNQKFYDAIEKCYRKQDRSNKQLQEIKSEMKYIDRIYKEFNNDIQLKMSENCKVAEKELNNVRCELSKKVDNSFAKISELGENISALSSKVRELDNCVEKKYVYNNDYERRVIKCFYDYYEREDYEELFLNLINGMEQKDVATIVTILKRQLDVRGTEGKCIDLYTKEEQEMLKELEKTFRKQILKISDKLYCWKNYLLPTPSFDASVLVYRHGLEVVETLDTVKNKDIIDVGGYIGDSVLILAPLTQKKVYTFEAVSATYEILKETLRLNRIENVVAENLALGSEKSTMEIKVAGSSSTMTDVINSVVQYTEEVQVVTLDEYVENNNVDVGMIKVDIEGAEQDFLKGARKTIEKYKPILLLSIYHNADDFFNIKPIVESWNLGYKFKIYKPVDGSISREVLLIAEVL